jgi:hypothetical protein
LWDKRIIERDREDLPEYLLPKQHDIEARRPLLVPHGETSKVEWWTPVPILKVSAHL